MFNFFLTHRCVSFSAISTYYLNGELQNELLSPGRREYDGREAVMSGGIR